MPEPWINTHDSREWYNFALISCLHLMASTKYTIQTPANPHMPVFVHRQWPFSANYICS
jgi:hypothetical protein